MDGSKRRKLTLLVFDFEGNLDEEVYWVEGIGYLVNPIAPVNLFPIPFDEAINSLDCFYKADEMMYQRPDTEDCYRYDIVTSEVELKNQPFRGSAFPNPVKEQLSITVWLMIK